MPVISITLTDAAAAELVAAVAQQFNYQPTVDGAPNPETQVQFARRMLIRWMKQRVQAHRTRLALQAVDTTDPGID